MQLMRKLFLTLRLRFIHLSAHYQYGLSHHKITINTCCKILSNKILNESMKFLFCISSKKGSTHMNGTLMKRLFHFWHKAAPTDTQILFQQGHRYLFEKNRFVKPRSFSLLTGIDTKPVTYYKLRKSLWK